MTLTLRSLLMAGLAALMLAAAAPAASPVKGGTYRGKVTSGGEAKVTLKVSSTGRRLTFVLSCYGVEGARIKRVKITNGRFVARKPYFEARGRFVTRRKAKGSISGNACFLQNAATWRATKT